MDARRIQQADAPTCPIPQSDGFAYLLVGGEPLDGGNCYIALVPPGGASEVVALYEGATGNVFACRADGDPRSTDETAIPIVRITGDLDGSTGQVTILQPDGSYRRFSRWDRVAHGSPAQPDARLRTLPQCGCGGSLGMPRLFNSFAEMGAYFYCTFALDYQRD